MIRKNILKRNIKRYSAGYIFALSLFSLVSVGFSSWITSENNSKAIDINLLADGSYQFFKLNSVENIDEYRLSKYGFIDSSERNGEFDHS